MLKSTRASYDGFRDIFGREARLREFSAAKISEVFQTWGYDKIELSVIENMESFSERVVGGSPWPEWNEKCSFGVGIYDFSNSYSDEPSVNQALLIPEGTISVSRWLANQIDCDYESPTSYPLKVYYVANCFRNEPIANLSRTKARSFTQVGMEIIGSSNRYADLETIMMIVNSLEAVGARKDQIKVRLGDIRIFNHLSNKTSVPYEETIILKEIFDAIAESRAGKDQPRLERELKKADEILSTYPIDQATRDQWNFCLAQIRHSITKEESSFLECLEPVNDLNYLMTELKELGVQAHIDLAVVRSHEYYTGIVFEVDLTIDDMIIVEIAGGGRYNKLISRLSKKSIEVPAIGFAFGLERICCLAESLRYPINPNIHFWLNESSTDIVLWGEGSSHELINYAQALRTNFQRVDIYAGDFKATEEVVEYAKQKNAIFINLGEKL